MNVVIQEIVNEYPVEISEEVIVVEIRDEVSYFDLLEVTDRNFTGKDGYVPTVNESTNKIELKEPTGGGGGGAVSSVFGRTGAVVAQSGDYDADKITETGSKVFVSPAEKTAIGHANRSILDSITEAFTTALKSAYDGAVSWIATNGNNVISAYNWVNTNGANVLNHIASSSNPHNVTKAQVGLSDVPNVDTSTTTNITEGTKLFFLTSRVLATTLSGLSLATGGAIVDTDSVLIAFGKIQNQLNAVPGLITSALGSFKTANFLDATSSIQNQLDKKDVLPVIYEKHANVPTWGGAALNNLEGFAFTITGATARNFADTNAYTRRQRLGLTVATTGNVGQARQTATYFNRNSNLDIILGLGFAENCTNANVRAFAGISATTLFTNVEPTALLNCIGIAKLTTSNNLHFIHNDGSGTATAIDLGASFPSNTIETDFYTLVLKTNGSNIDYLVTRVNTGDTASGTLSSDLPSASTALNLGYYVVQSTGANTTTGIDYFGTNIIKS